MGIPGAVQATFDGLKANSSSRLVLKRIRGRYYVYKEKGIWLKEKQKNKTVSEYLGRITEIGTFIKKTMSARDDLENAKALIAEHGGEIVWNDKENILPTQSEKVFVPKDSDLKLLTALSMNARISLSKAAKLAGIDRQTAYYKIKTMEKQLGIKYILELDLSKIDYIPYILLIKFEGNTPPLNILVDLLKNEPKIQFAAIIKGEYDLFIYLLDISHEIGKVIDSFRSLIVNTELGNYGARWNLLPIARTYSFVPLTDGFIEKILITSKLGERNKNQTKKQSELMHREYLVLRELNSNSNLSFSDIDKKHHLNKGSARYAYYDLKNKGIIVRATMTMEKLPIMYLGVITIANIYNNVVGKNRPNFLIDIITYGNITNRYSLIGNIGMPEGAIMFMPVFKDGDIEVATKLIEDELKGSVIKNMVVTNIVAGSLCYRRFDNTYSRQYKALVNYGEIIPSEPINYE